MGSGSALGKRAAEQLADLAGTHRHFEPQRELTLSAAWQAHLPVCTFQAPPPPPRHNVSQPAAALTGWPQATDPTLPRLGEGSVPGKKRVHKPVSQATEASWLHTYAWARPTQFTTEEGFRRFRCTLCAKYKQAGLCMLLLGCSGQPAS